MDVRGAALDRVEHHLVDEADDRCVVDGVGTLRVLGIAIVAVDDVEAVHLEIVASQVRHGRIDLLERLREQLRQLVLLDDDGFDGEAGRELDLVQRMQVRRIRNRDEQLLAALHQRQHAVLAQQLVADDPDGLEVGLDRVQVQQRGAKLVGGGDRDFACVRQVVLDEVGDDADAALFRCGDGLDHRALVHQAVRDQPLRQALEA